jgi:hypothetical protein
MPVRKHRHDFLFVDGKPMAFDQTRLAAGAMLAPPARGYCSLSTGQTRGQERRDEARHHGIDVSGLSNDADVGKFRMPLGREMRANTLTQSNSPFV